MLGNTKIVDSEIVKWLPYLGLHIPLWAEYLRFYSNFSSCLQQCSIRKYHYYSNLLWTLPDKQQCQSWLQSTAASFSRWLFLSRYSHDLVNYANNSFWVWGLRDKLRKLAYPYRESRCENISTNICLSVTILCYNWSDPWQMHWELIWKKQEILLLYEVGPMQTKATGKNPEHRERSSSEQWSERLVLDLKTRGKSGKDLATDRKYLGTLGNWSNWEFWIRRLKRCASRFIRKDNGGAGKKWPSVKVLDD